jgi:hypothetical protein
MKVGEDIKDACQTPTEYLICRNSILDDDNSVVRDLNDRRLFFLRGRSQNVAIPVLLAGSQRTHWGRSRNSTAEHISSEL